MPDRRELMQLVQAHRQLDEPMDAAVWIKQEDPTAWLVEVLPGLPTDPESDKPFVFGPSTVFRYSLHLISGTQQDLLDAVNRNQDLAQALSHGEILWERRGVGGKLIQAAQEAARRATAS